MQPKMNKALSVTATDAISPVSRLLKKKYGARGIRPPAMYETPIVAALRTARLGSGSSSPSSKRIMKSTQRFSSELIAATIG